MTKHLWRVLIVIAALSVVPGAVPAQTGSSPLSGGAWVGQYWPSSDVFYQVVERNERTIHHSGGSVRDGGMFYGASGSLRPPSWTVGLRLSVGHLPAGEVLHTASNHIPGTPIPLINPPPIWTVTYRSDLDIYLGSVAATLHSLPALGPVKPAVQAGITLQHRDFGEPAAVDTLRPAQIPEGYDVRDQTVFPDSETRPGLHLGSELSTRLLGTRLTLGFGDFLTIDAISNLDDGVAETGLNHDLYLTAGVGLD